jgi:histidinol-phosphate aminotransferase
MDITALLSEHPASLGRYPDPDSRLLRDAIAKMLNATGGCLNTAGTPPGDAKFTVTPDMVFVGNGSDEVLSFVFAAFFGPDAGGTSGNTPPSDLSAASDGTVFIVQTAYTYSFYPVYAGYYDLQIRAVPLAPDWAIDTAAVAAAANAARASFIIANPNAPTGTVLTRDALRRLLAAAPADHIHVIDEAYVDFAAESALSLLAEFPNLAIVRTFSKSFSFAGMRLGFLVANPPLIAALMTVKNSFNHFPVDVLTQMAGIAACGDADWYVQNARTVVAEREQFAAFLNDGGWEVLPSAANFLFTRKPGTPGRSVYEHCKSGGVLIRHFATPGIDDYVRITIGMPAEMQALQDLLGQVRQ